MNLPPRRKSQLSIAWCRCDANLEKKNMKEFQFIKSYTVSVKQRVKVLSESYQFLRLCGRHFQSHTKNLHTDPVHSIFVRIYLFRKIFFWKNHNFEDWKYLKVLFRKTFGIWMKWTSVRWRRRQRRSPTGNLTNGRLITIICRGGFRVYFAIIVSLRWISLQTLLMMVENSIQSYQLILVSALFFGLFCWDTRNNGCAASRQVRSGSLLWWRNDLKSVGKWVENEGDLKTVNSFCN